MSVLKQDSGTNLTLMNMTIYSTAMNMDAFSVGEAVKFNAQIQVGG